MHVPRQLLAATAAAIGLAAGTVGGAVLTQVPRAAYAVTDSALALAPRHGTGQDPVTATFTTGSGGQPCRGTVEFRWDRRSVGTSGLTADGPAAGPGGGGDAEQNCVAMLTFTPPPNRAGPGDHEVQAAGPAGGAVAAGTFTVDPAAPAPTTAPAPPPPQKPEPSPQPVRTTATPATDDLSAVPPAAYAGGDTAAVPGQELSLGPAAVPADPGTPAAAARQSADSGGAPWGALLLGGALFALGAAVVVGMLVRWRRHAATAVPDAPAVPDRALLDAPVTGSGW